MRQEKLFRALTDVSDDLIMKAQTMRFIIPGNGGGNWLPVLHWCCVWACLRFPISP